MTKRTPIPPADILFPPKGAAKQGAVPETVKTSAYLFPAQMEALDDARTELRKGGYRTATASKLIRAAVELAIEKHRDEWLALAQEDG